MKNSVILLAGGSSVRMNLSCPKQYIELDGKSILEICLDKFITHPRIDQIVIVINRDHYRYIEAILNRDLSSKLLGIVEGGRTRALSTINGLKFLENYPSENVLIHDIVRPFCSHQLIDNILIALDNSSGVIPIIRPVDTIKELRGGTVLKTLDRNRVGYVQTPQGFKFEIISRLHFCNNDYDITDDSILFEKSSLPIHIIEGERDNQKITYKEDLERAKMSQNLMKIGQGFDVHAFIKEAEPLDNNFIMLGGVSIPYEYSLEAHSDGDVVLHALCDALLGTIGAGDIGEYFPPSDDRWRNAPSSLFVDHIMGMLKEKCAEVINIDVTILAEVPRINPYKSMMKQTISKLLNTDLSNINIKATTTEKLGFIGRKEGIACLVNLLVKIH